MTTRSSWFIATALLSCWLAGCGTASVSTAVVDEPTPAGASASDADSPCTRVDDSTLRSVGLNPATRRSIAPGANETSACSVSSGDLEVTIAAARTTFEEFKAANRGISEGLDFGSHPARMVRRPGSSGVCELALKSGDGIVLLTSSIPVASREWGMDPCGGMKQIARAIEPTLDVG